MSETPVKVLVFSDNSSTRQAVITGVGFKASKDTAPIEWLEAATAFGVFELVDSHDIAVLVLDGETQKEGGMSVAKELANTRENLPPILMLTARPQDQWLATWPVQAALSARLLIRRNCKKILPNCCVLAAERSRTGCV